MNWTKVGNISDWSLNQILKDRNGELWCVGTHGNIARWDDNIFGWGGSIQENDRIRLQMQIKMIAFDVNNNMRCVDVLNKEWKWEATEWVAHDDSSNWELAMIAYNSAGDKWCVGGLNNVGKWNEDNKIWESQGFLGEWKLKWLYFDPSDNTKAFCINTGGHVGVYDFTLNVMTPKLWNWELKMITSVDDKFLWCVTVNPDVGIRSMIED